MTRDLGTDLLVLLGPPGMAAHDAAALDVRPRPTPAQRPQRSNGPRPPQAHQPEPGTPEIIGLATVTARENLAQALILRLLTPRGSLAPLGHASYGSRLHELIGGRRCPELRARCKAYVLEAVAQEPRVEPTAVRFAFDVEGEGPSELRFELVVSPRTGDDDVELGLAVSL
jgi:phage baseplate assembly protein W